MKVSVIVNPGLEKLAKKEIKEILNVKAVIEGSLLSFETETIADLIKLQSVKRVVLPFGEIVNEKVDFSDFDFNNYFSNGVKLVVEVENVKGQDNRTEISKKVTQKLFPSLKNPSIDYKKPEKVIIVFDTGKRLVISLDYFGKEINSREYRVFAHSASFKGDIAYYFVRFSGFKKKEKLLCGFCKDGSLAIEAALFSGEKIFAFDTTTNNTTAARKNVKLAGVDMEINKYALEDLDLKYGEDYFDRAIFQITSKDEPKINEIYYQTSYILKKSGVLLFITRPGWDLSISEKFSLLKKEEFKRGGSSYKLWLLQLK